MKQFVEMELPEKKVDDILELNRVGSSGEYILGVGVGFAGSYAIFLE